MGNTLHHNRKTKKNRALWLLLAVLLAVAVAGGSIFVALRDPAKPGSSGDAPLSSDITATTKRTLPQSFIDRNTSSSHIVLSNITKGEILYTKAADEKCYPASLTKLVTAIVAVENSSTDAVVTIGQEVKLVDPESSLAYLTVGTRLTLDQLLKALLLPSGNDAAYAIATYIGRQVNQNENLDARSAIATFVTKMNEKAAVLGCTSTHFANPDGIHDASHYTTAADMLKIATFALQKSELSSIMSLASTTEHLLSGQTVTWKNSNKLIRKDNAFAYDGATGMKTGSTSQAGYCLIASAVREGQTSVAVVMGSKAESGRWEDASGLLDISFQ